jgi:AAA domain
MKTIPRCRECGVNVPKNGTDGLCFGCSGEPFPGGVEPEDGAVECSQASSPTRVWVDGQTEHQLGRDGQTEGVHLTRLSEVTMKRPMFAWEPRIPLGTLTLFAGLPGQGKSHLLVHLASRLTRGQLEGDLHSTPVDVVVASAEDAASFVLAPRFHAAGADMDRVHIVRVHHDGLDLGISIPDDLEAVRKAMEQVSSRFLMIDPLLAHIPVRIDGYKDQHVRVALAPLARLAEDLAAAMAGVMHLNKREALDLFSRIGGSGGFLAAARSGMLVGADPNDDGARVIVHGKANLTPEADSLKFRLEAIELANPDPEDTKPIKVARVAMLGASDLGVEDVLRPMKQAARTDAAQWLMRALVNGPQPVEWLQKAAEDAGHAWRTVERAKDDLGVRSDRVGGIAGRGRWEWSLPRA